MVVKDGYIPLVYNKELILIKNLSSVGNIKWKSLGTKNQKTELKNLFAQEIILIMPPRGIILPPPPSLKKDPKNPTQVKVKKQAIA